MFGKRKEKYHRRGLNPIFGLFRLLLSLIIFAILVGGVYSAYKQFSGIDPVKISPEALISNFASPEKILATFYGILSTDFKPKEILKDQKIIPIGDKKIPEGNQTRQKPKAQVSFNFALVADSHNENDFLARALKQAKINNVKFIIGLGDYTEVGTQSELQNAKNEFDKIGIRYFVTAGDHDLWDARDKQVGPAQNITQVFGPTYQSFAYDQVRLLILDNSDNYLGFGEDQLNWLSGEIERIQQENPKLVLAFAHEPLYHPSSTRIMGKTTPSLKDEAKKVSRILKNGGVKEIFSGDIHFFTRYDDPETGLAMTTVGAVTSQRNTQAPRFAIVTVYQDGTYEVEDVEIK